jgi:pyruvate,water dikinase
VTLLASAGGLVSETGGVLSNLATVLREFGIPAVVGLSDATICMRTGECLELDGARGVVVIKR